MSATTVSRETWAATLLSYKDTPFHHQGRLPGVGMDCPAPAICGSWQHGLKPRSFDITGYSATPDGSLQGVLDEHLIRVPRSELQLGDVVLNAFRLRKPQHIAYIVGELYGEWELLHVCATRGKAIVERIDYARYYRFVQGYRVPGVGE